MLGKELSLRFTGLLRTKREMVAKYASDRISSNEEKQSSQSTWRYITLSVQRRPWAAKKRRQRVRNYNSVSGAARYLLNWSSSDIAQLTHRDRPVVNKYVFSRLMKNASCNNNISCGESFRFAYSGMHP
jgi:ribosome-binding protein aMBF1 (putative translation factor)